MIGLIIPHADEFYSGHIAADGLKGLLKYEFDIAVILGPNHKSNRNGVFSDPEVFTMPSRQIDNFLDLGLEYDHSIKWVVNLINEYVDCPVVPIVIGSYDENLTERLSYLLTENSLLIVTSDLSHYLAADDARKRDELTLSNILNFNRNDLDACGREPIKMLMDLLDEDVYLVKYGNSGEKSGEWGRVVGYAAIRYGDVNPLLFQAEDILKNYLRGVSISGPNLKKAVFVTITRSGKLQACMGQVKPTYQFAEAIRQAFNSCVENDPRFEDSSNLRSLEIKISIFSDLVPAKLKDVDIGVDGLYVESGLKSAVFLPEVPVEQDWDLEEYLENILSKAGIGLRSNYKLYKFETDSITMFT